MIARPAAPVHLVDETSPSGPEVTPPDQTRTMTPSFSSTVTVDPSA